MRICSRTGDDALAGVEKIVMLAIQGKLVLNTLRKRWPLSFSLPLRGRLQRGKQAVKILFHSLPGELSDGLDR